MRLLRRDLYKLKQSPDEFYTTGFSWIRNTLDFTFVIDPGIDGRENRGHRVRGVRGIETPKDRRKMKTLTKRFGLVP